MTLTPSRKPREQHPSQWFVIDIAAGRLLLGLQWLYELFEAALGALILAPVAAVVLVLLKVGIW